MLDDPGRFGRAVVATPGGAAAPGSAAEGASADDVAPALAPAGGVGAPRGVAHFPQNAASGGFSPPQRLQVRGSGVAQLTQKLIPSGFSRAQRGHDTLMTIAFGQLAARVDSGAARCPRHSRSRDATTSGGSCS